MITIKVLGSGCSNCKKTTKLVEETAKEMNLEIDVQKETDIAAIMGYGALSTPGVVIDEELVHAGGVPSMDQIREWLAKIA